jgi:hypothetical protein
MPAPVQNSTVFCRARIAYQLRAIINPNDAEGSADADPIVGECLMQIGEANVGDRWR